jgi:phage tail-like protein
LDYAGGSTVTPCVGQIQIEFPRISLRRYLPGVFGEDPIGADFTDRLLAVFDTTMRSIESTIDNQAALFDPMSTPSNDTPGGDDFLSWLASWVGITLDRQWPEAKRRTFLKLAPKLYNIRGTREGLRKLLLAYAGIDQPVPLILEHFQLRRWLFVGAGRLGDQAVLWGRSIVNRSQLDDGAQAGCSQLITTQDPYRDPFHVYASKFTVFMPASLGQTAPQRKSLEQLLANESPAHTQYTIEYVQPRFRIGVQAMIGLDAVVGRYPSGATLGTATLDRGTVLGGSPVGRGPDGQPHPSMRIGSRSQIGSTTRLD